MAYWSLRSKAGPSTRLLGGHWFRQSLRQLLLRAAFGQERAFDDDRRELSNETEVEVDLEEFIGQVLGQVVYPLGPIRRRRCIYRLQR